MKHNTHFMYDNRQERDASFAQGFIAEFGQTDILDAQNIVSIGGDGILMRALRSATGKKVLGIIAPESNSRGFWTNRDILSAGDLAALFKNAQSYNIKPLKAEITFADGSSVERFGYNDIVIRPVHQPLTSELIEEFALSSIDVSIQSVLLNLKVLFARAAIGPARFMGSGLVFSTAFGSTALNSVYGGPALDIRNESIVLTGIGVSEPRKGFNSIVNGSDTVFEIEFVAPHKRQVGISHDSFAIVGNKDGSPITQLKVTTAHDRSAELILADNPGRRAYSALMI